MTIIIILYDHDDPEKLTLLIYSRFNDMYRRVKPRFDI